MVLGCRRQGSVQLVLIAMLVAPSLPALGQRSPRSVEQLIGDLDHESFATRQAAANALRSAGLRGWQQTRGPDSESTGRESTGRESTDTGSHADDPVASALHAAARHDSLEVRMAASRILDDLATAAHDAELERLLNPHCEASTIRLDHWLAFVALVGDDMPARNSFATISRRLGVSPYSPPESQDASIRIKQSREQLDPYSLDPADTTAWMLLLMLDLEQCESLSHMTPRLAIALSHCPMGPTVPGSYEGVVLGRLIDRWVFQAGHLCGDRERLLIAMRYDRRQAARTLCGRVLEDDAAPAATVVTGLLVASVLGQNEIERHAVGRLEDDRVAHVWQMIPAKKTRIRTEVRDVALALLLHHRGIDPRDAGFAELQADPLLRYRDHSLGFPDTPSRLECRRRADQLLAKETDLVVASQRD